MKLIEVGTENIEIPFQYMDLTPGGKNLGRAEFVICQIYKYGGLFEYFVYPLQQRLDCYWHKSGSGNEFTIYSFDVKQPPMVWRTFWCMEHKTLSLEIYAPDYTTHLRLEYSGISFLRKG